uniref:Coiled-coil domain containing 120a n=1 Tax=Salmo trutta TaxID=8032 RepID=A0A673XKW1_SALTR
MEVKGHLISVPDLLGGSPEAVERMTELQERRRSLETLLNSRLAELRRVCLQEAELTGELPGDFPLEAGERRPNVRRRVGSYRHGPKTIIKTEEVCRRKPKKTLFIGALRRRVDSDQHPTHSKRTVHRGCHTDDTVNSESSSTSDSTGDHDNDESSGVAPDCLSPSRPRLAPGNGNGSSSSPDSRLCRKLSPVEIYYAMRTTWNSVRSLAAIPSNMEGRSVPTTPLLARNGPTGVHNHIRNDSSSTSSYNPEVTQVVPHQSQVGGPSPGPSSGPPSGSYEQGGGGGGGGGGGYSDILMDYVWGKQQQQQQRQVQQVHGNGKFPSSVPVPPPSHFNGYPHPQGHLPGPQHVSGGPPAYSSPLMLRGKLGEPRRVKVTRTKSCGPFIPLQHHQQEHGSGSGPGLNLNHNHQLGTPQYSDSVTPDDPVRSLHKALALEGLRDWYLRNSLGGVAVGGKVQVQDNRGSPRRRTTNSLHGSHPQQLPHQPQIYQGDRDRDYPPCQLPQSQTFHGHPLHGR